jgi:CheY-like chemotaxis protein
MPKILLIEDNEMNRDMLSRRLAKRGYAVTVAVDGEQGLALVGSTAPDLILMDMSLPLMDGWAATRLLKAAPATAQIPIIALTAHAMDSATGRRPSPPVVMTLTPNPWNSSASSGKLTRC